MTGKRPGTYWVTGAEQLAALTNARRHDIIDRLAACGPMSIRELARQIGAKPSALYHHIDKLLGVGLVVEAGRRAVARRHEQLYATPAPRMRLIKALAEGQQPELMAEIVGSLTRQMARDFRSGSQSPARVAEGADANYGFFRLVGRPTPAQLARINACLIEIAEVFWNSNDASSPLVGLGWVIAPLESSRDDGS
jgi:DNA-binding transcriptional ArsR family regulator